MKADRKKVKQIMAQAHMTVEAVARAAGLPPQTTAAIICGMNVQPDTLARIAQALGVDMADIAHGVAFVPQRWEAPPLPAGQVRVNTVRFAEAVARSGLTVTQLAKRAGVTPGTVRYITRGAEAHKSETVDKLADALGVAVCNIIKREGNP